MSRMGKYENHLRRTAGRPYKLKWTDSCRHTQSFASYEAAYRAAVNAEPCRGSPCGWAITLGPDILWEGFA